jgi:hypothetical protein
MGIFSHERFVVIQAAENADGQHPRGFGCANIHVGIPHINTFLSAYPQSFTADDQRIGERFFPGGVFNGDDHVQMLFDVVFL